MYLVYLIILMMSAGVFAALALIAYALLAERADILDVPTTRSNHSASVVTGAGIAFIPVALIFMYIGNASTNILLPALFLCIISFIDDRRHLPVKQRLGAQAIAVILGISAIHKPVLGGLLPLWLDHGLAMLAWLWFINLHNFMDGIDEITISNGATLAAGLALFAWSADAVPDWIGSDALVLTSAFAVFWIWNKHPARMFMGDAGSVPMGFIFGFLLLQLAAHGHWQAALILPAYYVADATYTLAKRALAKKPVWEAHSEHCYQQAVRLGRDHHETVSYLVAVNCVLAVLAVTSMLGTIAAYASLIVAYGLAGALMWFYCQTPKADVTPAQSAA